MTKVVPVHFNTCALRRTFLTGESPQSALVVGIIIDLLPDQSMQEKLPVASSLYEGRITVDFCEAQV